MRLATLTLTPVLAVGAILPATAWAQGPTVPAAGSAPAKSAVTAAVASDDEPSDTTIPLAVATAAPRYRDSLAETAAVALTALSLPGVAEVFGTVSARVASSNSGTWSATLVSADETPQYLVGTAIDQASSPQTLAVLAGLPTEASARYRAALHQVATIVVARVKDPQDDAITVASLEAVWLRTDVRRMTVLLTALAQVGTMYRYTGNKPGGFDCSGLTSYSWARAGVKIPRTSLEQIQAIAPRTAATVLPGDILWRPGHVGLYLGVADYMVHSPQTGKPVEVRHWGKMTRFGSPV